MEDKRIDQIIKGQDRLFLKMDDINKNISNLKVERLECKIDCEEKVYSLKLSLYKIILIALLSGITGGTLAKVGEAILRAIR